MRSRVPALAACGLLLSGLGLLAAEKANPAGSSPVVATVNGEPITKSEWQAIWKQDQWHAPALKAQPGFRDKMQGRPYEDFFFREEVVKIRAMAQKYAEVLPAMERSIDEIHARAIAGEDFSALARELSQDEGSAAHGGDLGDPKEFHDLVFPFNRVAFDLKEGEMGGPVLTVFGFHLLKVDKVFPAAPSEGLSKRVAVRNILIRFPSSNPREEAERLADEAKVVVTDKSLCKKLVSYCSKDG